MIKRFSILVALGLWVSPIAALAQDDQTLADIRQELTVLYVEVQKLKRELSTTGNAQVQNLPASVLERVNALESELVRVTSKTEELEARINRVVADGTNRIGDLEFRLVELEGGDISQLGETSTLGGESTSTASAPLTQPATPTDTASLAVGEKADFERAQEALANGDFRAAADQFATFNQTYPGGPLAVDAELNRGDALKGLGDMKEAARAYLAAFSTAPQGPLAARSLFELGSALGDLGQPESCVTLTEVAVRFPDSPFVSEAAARKQALACP